MSGGDLNCGTQFACATGAFAAVAWSRPRARQIGADGEPVGYLRGESCHRRWRLNGTYGSSLST